MHKIDTPNALNGLFQNRDEYARTPGTIVDASILQAVQDEIVHVIEAAGITLEKGNNTQLHAAVNKFISELNSALSEDIEKLVLRDSEFSRAIKSLQDSLASIGGPITNYGTTTLVKEHRFSEPTHNDYYAAPHSKGYAQVYLNGELLRRGRDWDSANNQLGIALTFKFTDVNPGLDSELVIVTFTSGDLIKVVSQLQIGMTTIWYGPEDTIPYGYIPLKGQLVESVKVDFPELYEMFKTSTNFADTRDAAKGSVVIIKGLDLLDLGADFSNRYYGPSDIDPVTNINGTLPISGDCYYNTTINQLKFFNGVDWSTMHQFFVKYNIVDSTTAEKKLLKSVSQYGIKSNDTWKLPNTLTMNVGEVIEVRAFDEFMPIIEVDNISNEKILAFGQDVTNFKLTKRSTIKFVYIGNRTYEIDDPLVDLRAELMGAFESFTNPVFVKPGDNIEVNHNCILIFMGSATVTLGEKAKNIQARLNYDINTDTTECIITGLNNKLFKSRYGSSASVSLKELHAKYEIYAVDDIYTVIF